MRQIATLSAAWWRRSHSLQTLQPAHGTVRPSATLSLHYFLLRDSATRSIPERWGECGGRSPRAGHLRLQVRTLDHPAPPPRLKGLVLEVCWIQGVAPGSCEPIATIPHDHTLPKTATHWLTHSTVSFLTNIDTHLDRAYIHTHTYGAHTHTMCTHPKTRPTTPTERPTRVLSSETHR